VLSRALTPEAIARGEKARVTLVGEASEEEKSGRRHGIPPGKKGAEQALKNGGEKRLCRPSCHFALEENLLGKKREEATVRKSYPRREPFQGRRKKEDVGRARLQKKDDFPIIGERKGKGFV